MFLISGDTVRVEFKQTRRDKLKVLPDIEGGPEMGLLQLKAEPDLVAYNSKQKVTALGRRG